MRVSQHQFVKCLSCGLVYIVNFQEGMTSYATGDYFTSKHQYISRWTEFCLIFEAMVDEIVRFKPGGRLLDVGTGVGAFLHVARQRGFEVQGVEVSEWASAFARNKKRLPVITGRLEDAQFKSGDFDVVIVNHVLEHVEEPKMLLEEIRRILKDDGMLVIGVPNIGSLMARLMGVRWASLRPKEHIWHFTPQTLKRLITLSGFHELYFEAKENYSAIGWGPKALIRRIINAASILSNRSEAMRIFAAKDNVSA
jgi:2-polyprenyl-3-methyl-5-hydroxy-6-metoxy-1,4-benzoquinol methylase